MKNKKKGFTLVELIVVLAILAILAAMLVPALTGYIDKANEKKIVAEARSAVIAAQTIASDDYAAGKITSDITESSSYWTTDKLNEVKVLAELKKGTITKIKISSKGVVESLTWDSDTESATNKLVTYSGSAYTVTNS